LRILQKSFDFSMIKNKLSKNQSHPLVEPTHDEEIRLETMGGTVRVEWDRDVSVSPYGSVVFFAQMLKDTGVYQKWVAECPLCYESPNAPSKADVLGTAVLSILAGHKRYAHATALRGDTVSPPLLGMKRIVSEDSLRRAFQNNIDEKEAEVWQQDWLIKTVSPLLSVPWVLDIDTTTKVLYGHQEGAEVSYNPKKPGRPSHVYHTYLVGGLRLPLDVDVQGGKSHTAADLRPGLWRFLDRLDRSLWPKLLRGDCAFGNEQTMLWPEQHNLNYLFKLRQSKNVQQAIRELEDHKGWVDVGDLWEAQETTISLIGWSRKRRVILMRRLVKMVEPKLPKGQTALFDMPKEPIYEHAALVTTLDLTLYEIAQLYRDRADAENTFDELKNQWGWSGFVTQDLKRCQIMARLITQIYLWWHVFVRMADRNHHREAITSRPVLLHSIARKVKSGGQTLLRVAHIHPKAKRIRDFFRMSMKVLAKLKKEHSAEQLHPMKLWTALLRAIFSEKLQSFILAEGRL